MSVAVQLMERAIGEMRAAGLTVIEVPGWRTRGWEDREFVPTSVVTHHDASPAGPSPGVPTWMAGQLDGNGNGAQWWVSLTGVWYAVAALWCPHTGAVLPGMPDNDDAWGVETDHTTGESWPVVQLTSLRVGQSALLRVLGRDAMSLHHHKSICKPKGRKVDPDGLDLESERLIIGPLITAPREDTMRPDQEAKLDRVLAAIQSLPTPDTIAERVWTRTLTRDDPSRPEATRRREATADRWLTGSRLALDDTLRRLVQLGKVDPLPPVNVAELAQLISGELREQISIPDVSADAVADAVVAKVLQRLGG